MIESNKAKYKDWFEGHSWKPEHCNLGRENYGNYISAYVRNQKQSLVLNLNGEWGTGKSHFLRQLYTDLLHVHGFPVVHIDAWKSDFSDDPLLVVISELLEQLHKIYTYNPDVEKKLLSIAATLGKRGWNLGVSIANWAIVEHLKFDGTATTEVTNNFKFDDIEKSKVGKSLASDYKQQLQAIEDTKKALSAYIETLPKTKRKVFVLVDELDRCRPTYAIELLETIKHFFNVDNFVFVVATDTQQLSHSIKAVYGNDFDGLEYLSRFFHRTAQLPEGERRGYIERVLEKTEVVDTYEKNTNSMIPMPASLLADISRDNILDCIVSEVHKTAITYDLSLRNISQLIYKLESIIVTVFDSKQELLDLRILIQLLAEYSSSEYQDIYQWRKSKKSQHTNGTK